jgi:hypothetical protein
VSDLIFVRWHLSGIIAVHTGCYFTPQMSFDPSNTISNGLYCTDRTCDGNLPRGQRYVNNWFDINCFPLPADFTFGNAGKEHPYRAGRTDQSRNPAHEAGHMAGTNDVVGKLTGHRPESVAEFVERKPKAFE